MRLTERVHHDLKQYLHQGDVAIDATAGNGHDTLFLAQTVGKQGQVFSFDVQAKALENTRQRVNAASHVAPVTYIHSGHEHLHQHIPHHEQQHIQAIVFNLGYLPQADHAIITTLSTTLSALQQACGILQVGGVISMLAYTGHPGGREEAEGIKQWLASLGQNFEYHIEIPQHTKLSPPEYILVRKVAGADGI